MNAVDHLPLPPAQYHVLVALTAGPQHGYALMQAVEDASNGLVRMGPATLYGTLKKLCDNGLARELAEPPEPNADQRRRYYELTALGQQVCLAESGRLATLVQRSRSNLNPGIA